MTEPTEKDVLLQRAVWSNQKPVIAGIGEVSQDPQFDVAPKALGFLAAPVTVDQSAVGKLLDKARSFIGLSGYNSTHVWYNTTVYNWGAYAWPSCAAGVSRTFHESGNGSLMTPESYVPYMIRNAYHNDKNAEFYSRMTNMAVGDAVTYDWDRNFGPAVDADHVGIVERILDDGSFYAIEQNAGPNGECKRVWRDSTYVYGTIRYDWARLGNAATNPGSTDVTPTKTSDAEPTYKLDEDGQLGTNTIMRMQIWLGTTKDGFISNPSEMVKALQGYLNRNGITDAYGRALVEDGLGLASNVSQSVGPYNTIAALQRAMGTPIDGVLDAGYSPAIRTLQQRLNAGWFL